MKKIGLVLLCLCLCFTLLACKSKEVKNVEKMIGELGAITLDSGDQIESIEAAYEALPKDEQGDVENYTLLVDARETYDVLVEQRNLELIAEVESLIDGIGEVTINSKTDIGEAREAYNALESDLQERVSNADVLLAAEEHYALLESVVITNFQEIGCEKVNLFQDFVSSEDEWYDNTYASSLLVLMFQLQGNADGWFDTGDAAFDMYICDSEAEGAYDILLPTQSGTVCYVRYWPADGRAQEATVELTMDMAAYVELLVEAGMIKEYQAISLSTYREVLQVISEAL